MPNPNQTMLNFPLTRKAKTVPRAMTRSTSQDITLNIPQQHFATPTSLISNKRSMSIPGDVSHLNNDTVKEVLILRGEFHSKNISI